ncbi:MAG: hypothetical protein KTR32_14795, partial [Granulosicoccus sp.]|nr:hypothetical protein [Granulosicoccus sp.]
ASAAGDAFAVFLAAEMANGNCEHLVRLCADWSTHRQGVIDADNPASKAHQFMRITINTLLGCIRERLVRTAQYHPDSTRMSRMANRPIGEPDFLPAMSTGRA